MLFDDGLISVLNPCLVVLTFHCLIVNPKKSNPGLFPSYSSRVWAILVFSGFSSNPIWFNHSCITVFACNNTLMSLCRITKSSGYRIRDNACLLGSGVQVVIFAVRLLTVKGVYL